MKVVSKKRARAEVICGLMSVPAAFGLFYWMAVLATN